MDTSKHPRWSLPLRLEPEILRVGFTTVGKQAVERYLPMPFWQLTFFDGAASVELKKGNSLWRLEIRPQEIFVIPSDSERIYLMERPAEHYYLEFRYASGSTPSDPVELPAIIPCGPSADIMRRDLLACLHLQETDRFESNLLAWLLLWRLVRLARTAEAGHQDREHVVQEVQKWILENTADASLTPDALAVTVGYSRRRLDQIFVEQVGKPVSACIRDRRAQLAEDLLHRSSLPIKEIGARVGIPDPHGFNKFIRRNLGMSPTAIRAGE